MRTSFSTMRTYWLLLLFMSILFACSRGKAISGTPQDNSSADTTILRLADPTIFQHNGKYYLYGTGGGAAGGFLVFQSADLKNWEGPAGATNGHALVRNFAVGVMCM